MSFKVTLLAGVASLALATGGAQAQQFNATDYFVLLKICGPGPAPTGYPCVYDSKNQIVGLTTTDGPLLRRMGGTWYKLPYENTGFFNGYSFYYTSSDCSGTPYLITGGGSVNGSTLVEQLPFLATSARDKLWGPVGPAVQIQLGSEGPTPPPVAPADCASYAPISFHGGPPQPSGPIINARPAVIVDQTMLDPLFSVR